jgi:hypothetical protein
MRIKASSRGARASKSLLQRLAPLETGLFLPDAGTTNRPTSDRPASHRTYSPRACFGLGFASSCIVGGVALLVLPLVKLVDARVQEIDTAAPAGAFSLPSTDLPPVGRQLWWKLPPSEGQPAPRTGRVEVGSLGSPG